jgi:hypothetical protein
MGLQNHDGSRSTWRWHDKLKCNNGKLEHNKKVCITVSTIYHNNELQHDERVWIFALAMHNNDKPKHDDEMHRRQGSP